MDNGTLLKLSRGSRNADADHASSKLRGLLPFSDARATFCSAARGGILALRLCVIPEATPRVRNVKTTCESRPHNHKLENDHGHLSVFPFDVVNFVSEAVVLFWINSLASINIVFVALKDARLRNALCNRKSEAETCIWASKVFLVREAQFFLVKTHQADFLEIFATSLSPH